MGEEWGTFPPKLQFGYQPSYLNTLGVVPLNPGQQDLISGFTNHRTDMLMTNGIFPVHTYSEMHKLKPAQANDPHCWLYSLPPFHPNSVLNDKIGAFPIENFPGITAPPNSASDCARKRFLVVDQSGDQTTMMFTSWSPKPPGISYNCQDPEANRESNHCIEPVLTSEFGKSQENDVQSEMHEDTEELNALLYSDDESDSEDDEVTSTGHSPSTMTDNNRHGSSNESPEEVASSCGPTKKRKISDAGFDNFPSVMDTASYLKADRLFEHEGDAESCCGNVEVEDLEVNKKMRKEKIRETVSVLQSIIPGSNGKEAMVVIDEAIQYLKSLKLKAKALGFDSL